MVFANLHRASHEIERRAGAWMRDGDTVWPEELFEDLDRSGPVPIYFQISSRLEAAIHSGRIPSGARLENEISLGERLGVSAPVPSESVFHDSWAARVVENPEHLDVLDLSDHAEPDVMIAEHSERLMPHARADFTAKKRILADEP